MSLDKPQVVPALLNQTQLIDPIISLIMLSYERNKYFNALSSGLSLCLLLQCRFVVYLSAFECNIKHLKLM